MTVILRGNLHGAITWHCIIGRSLSILEEIVWIEKSSTAMLPTLFLRSFVIINHVLHHIARGSTTRIYVPQQVQQQYLQLYHDHPLLGHLGFHRVLEKFRSLFYRPQMRQSMSHHLRHCHACQSYKTPQSDVGSLSSISVTHPFGLVNWDLMAPFPMSTTSHKYIIVMTEYLTHRIEAQALPWSTASSVASSLLRNGFFDMASHNNCFPIKVHNSKVRSFTSSPHPRAFANYLHPLPPTNQWVGRTAKQNPQADYYHMRWPSTPRLNRILPFGVHAYNTSINSCTWVCPIKALYNGDPQLPLDLYSCHGHNLTHQSCRLVAFSTITPIYTEACNPQELRDRTTRTETSLRWRPTGAALFYRRARLRLLPNTTTWTWWVTPTSLDRPLSDAPICQLTYPLNWLSNGTTTSMHVSHMKPYYLPFQPPTPAPLNSPPPTPKL